MRPWDVSYSPFSTLSSLWSYLPNFGNCRTPDWQSSPVQLLIGKSGRLYIRVVVCSVVRHGRDSSDVTLALEDAQVVRRSVGRY